jgi:multidrug efflux pump subunit AcrA (membrane-fusion protein)
MIRGIVPCLLMPLLLVLIFSSSCSKSESDPAAAPSPPQAGAIEVSAFKIQPESIHRTVELVGTLEGEHEVTVSSEVAARVTSVRVDLGDPVQLGQSIVELDSSEFRLAVDRQRSALLQVLTQLGAKNESDPLPETSQTSIVRKAAADLADAKSNFERTRDLVAKSVEAKATYDSAEARYEAAQANYTAAQEQVRNLRAQVDNLRIQLALAQEKLADCTIRAPFNGTVKERLVDVGQYVREQTPVMSITTMNPLKLLTSVPERWFPYVGQGALMELKVEAYDDRFPCKVRRVGLAVDPQSRTFNIEATVDNSSGRLRPGLFVRASLTTSKVDSVIRVPAGAVISYYGVQKVYVIDNGLIRERVVKLGDRIGDFIEITQGLHAGERIATSELTRMQEGVRVKIREES